MKLAISLRPEGHLPVAKGDMLWSWHFAVHPESANQEWDKMSEGSTFLGYIDVELPSTEVAVKIALTKLKAKEQEIQAQAYRDVQEVQEERSKLLSIAYSTPAPVDHLADDVLTAADLGEFQDAPF